MADDVRQAQATAEASKNLIRVTEELRDFNQSLERNRNDELQATYKMSLTHSLMHLQQSQACTNSRFSW